MALDRNQGRAVTAAAAAAVLACLLTVAPAGATIIFTNTVTVEAQQCLAVPIDFSWRNFDYRAYYSTPQSMPTGCLPSDFQVSRLYMGGTCTSLRNNQGSGCGSSSGTVVPNTYGTLDPSICSAVYADAPSGTLITLNFPNTNYRFDADSLCTKTDYGFLFVRNNCNQSASPLLVDLTVDAVFYSGGCGSSSLPEWARITIGVLCALAAVALLFFTFKRCRRPRPPPPPATVQMAGAGSQPPFYIAGDAGGTGYGQQPAYAPGYAGAWGVGQQQPAGYPPPPAGYPPQYGAAGGYGAPPPASMRPQHYPPPMTTVTVGAPVDEPGSGVDTTPAGVGSGGGGSGYPPPSSSGLATAGGSSSGGPYPKV